MTNNSKYVTLRETQSRAIQNFQVHAVPSGKICLKIAQKGFFAFCQIQAKLAQSALT